jgi:hypothetical protein
MAITRVGEAEASAINDGDPTLTLPTMQENDVVVISACGGGSAPTMTTSGYTITNTGGSNASSIVAWKRMGASPDATAVVNVTGAASLYASAAVATVFRGVDTTTAIDATITIADGGSGSPDSPSITTVTDGAGVISAMGLFNTLDTSVTAPSGYGDQVDIAGDDSADATAGLAWLTKVSAGAENPAAWTNVTSGLWGAATIALRPAGAGAAGQPTIKRAGGVEFMASLRPTGNYSNAIKVW